ncbi:MAG: hypothetical protein ACYC7A_17400 [Thermoanaerobaculia bacterium]
MRCTYLILFLAFLLPVIVQAQSPPSYEQFLAPFDTMVAEGPGVRWSAELRVRNSSDVAVNLFPEECFYIGHVIPCDMKIIVPPRTAQVLDVMQSSSLWSPGVLLYVPSSHVDHVHFSLSVRDADSADTVGTTIPVVRRSAFRSRFIIPGIPVTRDHRRTLRIYEPHTPPFSRFRVRVIDDATGAVLSDQERIGSLPTDPTSPVLVPATFDFSDALGADALHDAQHVSVVVERLFPEEMIFWALISLTSNRDNSVAVYTPN